MIRKFMTKEISEEIEKAMRNYKIERARALHKAGYTYQEIAETLGVPMSEVRELKLE